MMKNSSTLSPHHLRSSNNNDTRRSSINTKQNYHNEALINSNQLLTSRSPKTNLRQRSRSKLHERRVSLNKKTQPVNKSKNHNNHHSPISKKPTPSLLFKNRSQTTFDVLLPSLHRQQLAHLLENKRAAIGQIGVKVNKKEALPTNHHMIQAQPEESNSTNKENLRLPLHVDVPVTLSCDVMVLRDMNPSQTVDVNISMSLTDFSRSMYESAIERLTKTLLKNPHAFLPHFIRGMCHYYKNEYELARRDFSACCCASKYTGSKRQEYDTALAFFNRSVVWMKMNDASKAMEDINKAIEICPFEKSFFCNRAILYRRKGDFEAAQHDYRVIRRMESEEMKEFDNCAIRKQLGTRELMLSPKRKNEDCSLLSPIRRRSTRGQNQGWMRKTLLGRKTIHGNKSPCAKRPKSLLDLKTTAYGQVHSALTCLPNKRTKTQLDVLVKESRMMSAFAHLDNKQLATLWKFLEYKSFPSNTRLFNEGDKAEDYMLVWSGSVSARVLKHNNFMEHSDNVASALIMEREFIVNTMKAGETLGEAIMLEGGIRKASCVTEEPSEILLLKKEHFRETFHVFLQKAHDDKVAFLSSFDFLSEWSREKLDDLAHLCREKRYHRGETIIQQADRANSFYFIKTGMLSAVRRIDGDSQEQSSEQSSSHFCVSKLCSGDIFGEATIIGESEMTVFPTSIVSETLTICFRLDKVQMKREHWDTNTKTKLAERIIKIQDDETLRKTKSNENKFKKQSEVIVRKVRNMIRSKNMISKYSR